MTALSEIRAALANAPKVRRGWERAILCGFSAWQAVNAEMRFDQNKDAVPLIDGVYVTGTSEFHGWALREIGPNGVWLDVVHG